MGQAGSADDTTKPSLDTVLDVLRHERRRKIIEFVSERSTVELTDLAELVAADENECEVHDLTRKQRKRVYVSVYQTHRRRLEQVDVIEYDSTNGEFSKAQNFDLFETISRTVTEAYSTLPE